MYIFQTWQSGRSEKPMRPQLGTSYLNAEREGKEKQKSFTVTLATYELSCWTWSHWGCLHITSTMWGTVIWMTQRTSSAFNSIPSIHPSTHPSIHLPVRGAKDKIGGILNMILWALKTYQRASSGEVRSKVQLFKPSLNFITFE